MPTFVGDTHEKSLRAYLSTGKSQFIDQQRELFIITKSGYLQFVKVLIKIHPSIKGRIMFVASIKRLQGAMSMIQ